MKKRTAGGGGGFSVPVFLSKTSGPELDWRFIQLPEAVGTLYLSPDQLSALCSVKSLLSPPPKNVTAFILHPNTVEWLFSYSVI